MSALSARASRLSTYKVLEIGEVSRFILMIFNFHWVTAKNHLGVPGSTVAPEILSFVTLSRI